jgi:hypothetical protein
MIRRGSGSDLGGALLATTPSTILSADLISIVIRGFIYGSIVSTDVVAQREGALA